MAISKCYTESKPVADGYFQAIASILADGYVVIMTTPFSSYTDPRIVFLYS